MKVIAVTNIKGGVAKTSTATALAAGIKRQRPEASVLLIDADPQGSIKTQFGLKLLSSNGDFSGFLIDDVSYLEAIQKVDTDAGPIDVMISSRRLSDADIKMAAYPRREETLKLRFNKQGVNYDYVVIDTSPAMNLVTLNILIFSNYLLVPATMDAFAVSNIKYIEDQVKVIKDFYDEAPEIMGIVPTMFDKRVSLTNQFFEAVKKYFGKKYPIFQPIGIDATVKKAQVKKQFIYDFPQSRAATQYSKLTEKVLEAL